MGRAQRFSEQVLVQGSHGMSWFCCAGLSCCPCEVPSASRTRAEWGRRELSGWGLDGYEEKNNGG